MSILALLVLIALIGLAAWAIPALIPMPELIKRIIYAIAIGACILIALQAFGLLDELRGIRVPRV